MGREHSPTAAWPAGGSENHYQQRTSASKLRGQYYTPEALVRLMVDEVSPAAGDVVFDPSCGDGGFLCGVVAHLASSGPDADPKQIAELWVPRLVGCDSNPEAVRAAGRALSDAFFRHFNIRIAPNRFALYCADPLETTTPPKFVPRPDAGGRMLVLGNPPYVEAKRLDGERKRELTDRFPGAVSGAPDLYLYFLYACLEWLRPGDRLALVLPNKVLVNQSARALRERLLEEHRLQSVWLATDTRAFGEAGVYPIVLFAGAAGAAGGEAVEVRRLADMAGTLHAGPPALAPHTWYRRTTIRAIFPPPEGETHRAALRSLLGPQTRLGDVLQIRWSVSFHRAGLRERYVTAARPDSAHARRFLGGGAFSGNGEVARYRLQWGGWWMDYDDVRLRAEGNAPPPLELFRQPKIVICQNARTLRAAYDDTGVVLKDTFLCGVPLSTRNGVGRHPRALVALLCSRTAHFFFSHVFFGGHVNGGYLHFLQGFLVDLPVGAWTDSAAAEAEALVRMREDPAHEASWTDLEERIEALVRAALGLPTEQGAAIDAWIEADRNWQRRERIRGPSGNGQRKPSALAAAAAEKR